MWARWNHIQSFLFPWMREDIDPMTEALGRLVTILDVIGLESFVPEPPRGAGRPPEDRRALARAFVAKAVLGIPTTIALIERLALDKSLRRILGWERRAQVPSEATFSRAFAEFANGDLPGKMHAALIQRSLGGRIIGVIARDATEIDAREKPAKNEPKDDPPPASSPPPTPTPQPPSAGEALPAAVAPPKKRGRPKKGQHPSQELPKPEPKRIERQATQTLAQMLADLPNQCDVGTKKNSKGYKTSWTGYKLHLDVACGQIPVSAVLTSASLHDSQVAIPLMTMTGSRVSYLYDLMDAAYDAKAIAARSKALGHIPIIDRNFRAAHEAKIECAEELARMELIHMPDPDDVLYNFRTMVERVNGRLKDEFGATCVRVRGAIKVKCHLMFGVLALTVDQLFRLVPPKTSPA
ncbi:MAG: transposase [Roseiarcus sp.]